MKPTLRTRKPIDEVTTEDLGTFLVWDYSLDEEGSFDETHVRPLEVEAVPPDACVEVAARFWLSSGVECLGLVRVTTTAENPEISPSFVMVGSRSVGLPTQSAAIPDIDFGVDLARANLPRALGLPMNEILPAKYQLLVLVAGESAFREGIVQ